MASNIVFDGTKGISLPSFTTTEKNAIVSPATGATVFDTTQNRQNVYAGGAWNAGLNSGTAVASTSGTSIDFTGIPSWVKRITVMFNGVSTNGTSNILVQIGSGSVTSSGYISTAILANNANGTSGANSTAGFIVYFGTATHIVSGSMVINQINTNTWVSNYTSKNATTHCGFGGGDVTLSGTLDRLRITSGNGTDTFDAGSINILYE